MEGSAAAAATVEDLWTALRPPALDLVRDGTEDRKASQASDTERRRPGGVLAGELKGDPQRGAGGGPGERPDSNNSCHTAILTSTLRGGLEGLAQSTRR